MSREQVLYSDEGRNVGRWHPHLMIYYPHLTSADLDKLIRKGNGTATLTTASGGSLWLMKNGDRNITVKDETGAVADISIYDVLQSNGVIHSIDRVLMPK